ncbi:hypothetical protein B0H11DRAFT_1913839 [Mycena galericulata]|nr:hypothetical protein B0H11DRAFT_1913839 [Mycena galericulata]
MSLYSIWCLALLLCSSRIYSLCLPCVTSHSLGITVADTEASEASVKPLQLYLTAAVACVWWPPHQPTLFSSDIGQLQWSMKECFSDPLNRLRRPPLCRTGCATRAVEVAGMKDERPFVLVYTTSSNDIILLIPFEHVEGGLRNLKSNREHGAEAARTGTWIVHVIEDATSLRGGVPLRVVP